MLLPTQGRTANQCLEMLSTESLDGVLQVMKTGVKVPVNELETVALFINSECGIIAISEKPDPGTVEKALQSGSYVFRVTKTGLESALIGLARTGHLDEIA